jgi:hypothetical protein
VVGSDYRSVENDQLEGTQKFSPFLTTWSSAKCKKPQPVSWPRKVLEESYRRREQIKNGISRPACSHRKFIAVEFHCFLKTPPLFVIRQ